MPPMQQLLRTCRSCQVLLQMPLQQPVACHPVHRQHRTHTAASGSQPVAQWRQGSLPLTAAAARSSCCSISNSSNGRRHNAPGLLQHWGGLASRSSSRGQHVAFATSQPSSTPQGGPSTVLTLPTILTLGRVAAIPALIAAWFWQDPAASTAVTALFIAASLTDWLDGYLARKMNASTPFGAFLDPVADKLMVAAVLILLSTQPLAAGPFAGNTWFVPVATLVIIGREISMSALREWAATLGPAAQAAVAVNAWGKWKTATQMVALTCLLLTKDGAQGQLGMVAAAAGPPLLAVAAYLTAHSLALYVAGLWRFMK